MPTSVRLPADLEARLDALARSTGRSKAFYVREAIASHLEELEDAFLAERILKRIRTGREKTLSLDEVERGLELAR